MPDDNDETRDNVAVPTETMLADPVVFAGIASALAKTPSVEQSLFAAAGQARKIDWDMEASNLKRLASLAQKVAISGGGAAIGLSLAALVGTASATIFAPLVLMIGVGVAVGGLVTSENLERQAGRKEAASRKLGILVEQARGLPDEARARTLPHAPRRKALPGPAGDGNDD